MSLDILTPKGREAAEDQVRAINIILAQKKDTQFIHTALDDKAAIDGFFVKGGEIRAAAEVKCRYDMTYEELMGKRKGEWLITYQKIVEMKSICRLLSIPGYGVLYLVKSHLVLVKQLVEADGSELHGISYLKTPTQRTINGGEANRLNAFVQMKTALKYQAL